jgi:hypothetical protein
MKRIIGVFAVICLTAALVVSCASAPSASDGIQKARSSAPSGALVVSATGSDAAAAEKAAKEQLSRALIAITNSIIQEAATANEITSAASGELIQRTSNALTRSSFNTAIKQGSGEGKGKQFWAVFYMEKTDVVAEINRVATGAKSGVAGADNFSINSRIDAKYQSALTRTWSN